MVLMARRTEPADEGSVHDRGSRLDANLNYLSFFFLDIHVYNADSDILVSCIT